jgi:Glycine rich protein
MEEPINFTPCSRRRPRRPMAVVIPSVVTILLLAVGAAPARATTVTYHYTGGEQAFVAPAGVYQIEVVAIGGHGGETGGLLGGEAAEVHGTLDVEPGQPLYVEVGGNGKPEGEGGEGGFNGGGSGAGGGGGASDIRTSPRAAGLSPDIRMIVAGAGGGAGASGEELGGAGGAAGEAGGATGYAGGGAGTESEGGGGASGCELWGTGGAGFLGVGGAGGNSLVVTGPGGGGGGGLFGGGGGGGACHVGSSGGGGGSSKVPPLGLLSLSSAQPKVEIGYFPPPSITISTPEDGAQYTQGQAVNVGYACFPGEGTSLKSCTGPVPNGAALDTTTLGVHTFTVGAEDIDKGRVSMDVSYTVVASTPASAQRPNTKLVSHPKKTIKTKKKKVKVRFTFSSDVGGATFECKLDKHAFARCPSPKSYKVKRGKHTFSVRAVGAGGTDPSPVNFKFKVKKKK